MARLRILIAPVVAGAVLLAAAPGATAAKRSANVTVMTRNVFLGADLIPIAVAPPGAQFEKAAGDLLREVDATDPNARMKLIAREIAKAKPHLVGLQEVSIWRTGPKGNPAQATTVRYNFLAAIMKELKRRHQSYRVVARKLGFNVEGPTDQNVDVRLTLGDVVIARKGVKVKRARSGLYASQLTIPTAALGPVNTSRSWNALDATVRGVRFHFVNAHLEAYSPDVRLDQAKELVAGPLKSSLKTILAGDLNSGPDLAKPEDRPPYAAIHDAGFRARRLGGNVCCFDDLRSDTGWNHDVDWIMTKPGLPFLRGSLVGREKTTSGVHPADHGGIVSTLRVTR